MPRIVIRADAGSAPEIGTGHILRAIKLADALRQTPTFQSFEFLFATRQNQPYQLGANLVKQAGYNLIPETNLEPNTTSELFAILSEKPDLLIMDRLATAPHLILNLKKQGVFTINVDDLGDGHLCADLSIHPLLHSVRPGPTVFIGYEYLFLPSSIKRYGEIRQSASSVLISFGGFDHRRLTLFALNQIPNIRGPKRYDVVVSDLDSKSLDNISARALEVAAFSGTTVIVHQRPEYFHKLISASDLAIVSGGLTAFQCAQAGLPTIGIPQYEHQLENLNRLAISGCLVQAARDMVLDPNLLSELVTRLYSNYNERLAMSKSGQDLIDGKGLKRTVRLIDQHYRRYRSL